MSRAPLSPGHSSKLPRMSKRAVLAFGVALIGIGAVSACGGSNPPEVVSVTVTETAVSTHVVTVAAEPEPAPSKTTAAVKPSRSSKAEGIVVPDGVGMNYQDAQDLWRSAGLIVAPATDATGANRLPFLDSNWVVLAQDLTPGDRVPADSMITATVKKYSDN